MDLAGFRQKDLEGSCELASLGTSVACSMRRIDLLKGCVQAWGRYAGGILVLVMCMLIVPTSPDATRLHFGMRRRALHTEKCVGDIRRSTCMRLRGGARGTGEGRFAGMGVLTVQDREVVRRADYIIQNGGQLNFSVVMALAVLEKKETATVFLGKGRHNLSFEGEIEPPCEMHINGQEGSVIQGYAEPIKLKGAKEPFPESGGGRFRFERGATGSTCTNLK